MGYFRKRTGVLRSNRTFTKYNRVKYVKGIKQPNDKMGKYAKPPTLQKVIQLINSKVSSVVENKKSANHEIDANVLNYTLLSGPIWFNTGTTYSTMWNMGNGAGEQERIGNRYKVKKWTIKGFIYPALHEGGDYNDIERYYLPHSFQGKITVYLGKLTNGNQLPQSLSLLLQNGNTDVDPIGKVKEQLFPINNDKYKIYWKRTFNVGFSAPLQSNFSNNTTPNHNVLNVNSILPNNDLKLHSQFTIDVLKYIGKNATIKFNDGDQTAYIPSSMKGLTLFATFAPFDKDLTGDDRVANSFYKIWSNSFYEYEDA